MGRVWQSTPWTCAVLQHIFIVSTCILSRASAFAPVKGCRRCCGSEWGRRPRCCAISQGEFMKHSEEFMVMDLRAEGTPAVAGLGTAAEMLHTGLSCHFHQHDA